jgi:hypothetical protein
MPISFLVNARIAGLSKKNADLSTHNDARQSDEPRSVNHIVEWRSVNHLGLAAIPGWTF